jgi:hypothetical protein
MLNLSWTFANLCQIYERIKRRGGEIYPSENEDLGRMYSSFELNPENFTEEDREIFEKIFQIMLEKGE